MNNVTREIRRGTDNTAASTISGQVETDDQITTYTYGIGGRLTSEMDATGAVTEYEYDLNGNITKETLKNRRTADQVINNQAGTDDITTYTYDSLNRQTKTTDLGTTVVEEVQYSSFNQITGKRTYTTTTAPQTSTTWDEYSQYDQAGRVWKSNSGDGVTKVYISDKNGNVTASISSTVDMGAMTFNDIRALSTGQTMYTFSVYDKKNQLMQTIQPSMDVGNRISYINNPLVAGSLALSFGNVSWSYSWDRVGSSNHKDYYLLPSFTIPSTLGLSGNTKLEITSTATNGQSVVTYETVVIPEGSTSASSRFFIGRFVDVGVSVSLSLRLVQSTPQGDIVLGTQSYSGGLGGGGSISIPSRMYIANQPYVPGNAAKSTAKVLLSYRPVGTNQPYTTITVPNMVNTAGAGVGGLYAFDPNAFGAGEFEYQYVALNNSGEILNQQSGSFNTTIAVLSGGVNLNPANNVTQSLTGFVTQTGNTIAKTGGINGVWDADAISAASYTGSVYISAKVGQTNTSGIIGLSKNPTASKGMSSLDYAWYTAPDGKLYVYENGVSIAYGSYSAGSELTINYEGTTVQYIWNGEVRRSVNTTAGQTFYMDSSFYNTDHIFYDVKFGNSISTADGVVLANENALIKTGGSNSAWDSAVFSSVSYTGSAYVSARAGQTNLYGMIGLSENPMAGRSYTTLNYAWYPAADGNLYIYEGGTQVGQFGAYTPADVVEISYEGTTVKYLKNGTVMRTVNTTAGRAFYMDSSFLNIGYTFNDVKFGLNALSATDVVLNSDNAMVKTGGSNGVWDSAVSSSLGYTGSAYVSARAGQTNLYGMIGLSTSPMTNASYTSINYAWYPAADGNLYIYEGETQVGQFGAYTPADVLSINYEGTTVKYLKNGTVMRTVNTTSGRTFYMDSSFHNIGYVFNDVRFGRDATAGVIQTVAKISGQTPLAFGEVGRAFFNSTSIAGMSSGLQLINQGVDAASVVMRYRLKNTSGSWISPGTSFTANTGFGTGSFVLDPAGLSGMTNGNDYDIEFDIKNNSGYVIRTVTSIIKKDSAGFFSIGALTNPDASLTTDIEIKRSQTYNAFGEIISETDGRGNVTSYTYNAMGAMTKKIAPMVSITSENGSVNINARPTTEYIFDAIGRVIAVKDANGNLNTQVWLTGSINDEGITLEKHADGGIKKAGFDIFGNKRTEFDELATGFSNSAADAIHRTDYTYDKENRLTRIDRQARANGTRSYDEYGYDAAGNRISHTTSSDVTNSTQVNATLQTEKTYYDSLGRVTQTKSFMDFSTTYTYTYVNSIVGIGGTTVSGWQKTTTDAVGRTLIDKIDMFNHVTWHKDLGGHQFTYAYNQAGWLISQTSLGAGSQYSGQNIVYSYYNNGNIKDIHDKTLGMYTYYEYDLDGNRTFEGYISLKEAGNLAAGAKDFHQYSTIEYDAMNRMISMADPKANIVYEYDAVGNRRMVKSTYHDGANGSLQVQEYWYKYDSMNRFLITMGTLNGNRGVATSAIARGPAGSAGVDVTYNVAGQRTQAINAVDNTTEGYSYTNDGYLTNVTINGVLRSSRSNDALGRVFTYNEFGNSTYIKNTFYDKDNRVTRETGTDGTTDYYYYEDVTDNAFNISGQGRGSLARTFNWSNTGTTINTYYAYEYWDDAKQLAITNQGYNPKLKGNNAAWKPGYSELKYDVNGHLAGAVDRSGNRNFRYVNDAQGLILLRDEVAGGSVNRVQRYYYVDGKRVGDVGNDGPSRTDYVQAMANRGSSKSDYKNWKPVSSADFDQNYEPVSPSYPGFAATTYTVKNGDTLQSIARTVWGDADMWYLIADANGLTNSNTLTAGQVLTIPNKVTNIHNNSGTYRVYNPGEAIGDVNPTLPTAPPVPRKKKKGCGGFASIIVAAVAVVATIYTAGVLAGPAAVAAAGGSTMAAGVSALGAGSLGFGAAFAAGAAGSIAGQLAGNALGVQSGFSWGAVATAGLTSGILSTSPMKALTQAISGAANGGYAAVAARAVIGNVVGQGIGNFTGSQKGFNWSSVAISGIGAAAGAAISDKLQLTSNYGALTNGTNFGADLGRAAVSAGSFALTQLVVSGGKVNWQQVATDTVTNLIQNRAESKAQDVAVQNWFDGLTQQQKDTYLKSNLVSNDDSRMILRPDGKSPWGEGSQVASRSTERTDNPIGIGDDIYAIGGSGIVDDPYVLPEIKVTAKRDNSNINADNSKDITFDQLKSIMPNGRERDIEEYLPHLNAAMSEFGINTPKRQAMFLSQIAVESGGLRYTEENLRYSAAALIRVFPRHFNSDNAPLYARNPEAIANRIYANRMGNGNEATGDGYRYRGGGLLQATGRKTFATIGARLGVDLVSNPELLRQPELAARSAAEYFQRRGLNELADQGNIREVTRRVNGATNGPTTHLDLREQIYQRALQNLER
ncbi:LysM peptidoglycan-binding domain-containing protein [Methylophilus methylotrophus]|uniref:LysM peptidoglycan-binding domain-containing protein n=1 Tax=Methylophilus methylotrophus TaxID=17 RepID=UPI000F59FC18|nr:LysM peptidoglycan-binding domain-containing protein [Methylophilus methylotrophus]